MYNESSFSALLRRGRLFINLPAVQALLIQLISFIFALILLAGIWRLFDIDISRNVVMASLLQGTIAMALTYQRQMAPWWWLIQLIFPCSLALTFALQIPSGFFLAAFILLLGVFWSTFRTQVPFYPSNSRVWSAIENLLPHNQEIQMIDIGSGLGGLILHLAAKRPESRFTGIELAPIPWLLSAIRASYNKSSAHFIRGNYDYQSLANYDVVFAYLSPAAMTALWQKAAREMRSGTLLISYEFTIKNATPSFIIASGAGGPDLYGWHI